MVILLGVLTVLLLAATGISFLRISHGAIRVFAFPRLQILTIAAILLLLAIVLIEQPARYWIAAGLALVIAVQAVCIAQFSPLRSVQSKRYAGEPNSPERVSILSYNVKMSNRRYQDAIDLVTREAPDIALFMETDEGWAKALEPLGETMPYVVAEPLGNTYGIMLYSRLKLAGVQITRLVMDDVPSVIAQVTLRSGKDFRLYGVHPEPPVPYADSAGRDAELIKVARRVEADPLPAVVCGDLNDVAWSHTTRHFQRISRLLDPRVGRGFYNTFDARYPLLRWPLDHLFHDARFDLITMRRLDHIGSDHFPMLFALALTRDADAAAGPDKADAADQAECEDIIEDASKLDREAIGSDWEK
ncbi:endonuclease/exonuclease/phosphatase family protein [Jiella sp. MQZ9-1]|uniref:Endonuclease/exonuclease/phosphatase family protein n=1 Tax=Jiella flava TaxID=2816857 RepID=A0A939JU30_9HYPH|nr:endonuclease/exonuclease/phosphatase family protein [Jiella flava]MBO0660994.1 endonuclease/exonuclease/phosphatase family protein [Jiella flava]MCD2469642.1 endonuclease/exonuclease/phosphatase family protein [Jiella flava]